MTYLIIIYTLHHAWFNVYPMGKIICTIKSWWQDRRMEIQTLFETLYLFYTSPIDEEYILAKQFAANDAYQIDQIPEILQ